MTVIPRRNFKEWLQLYVNFCEGGEGGEQLSVNKRPGGRGGGYYHIWAIWVCAAVKGMVFKQFTLRVWV